jgi:S1-C subfamily serine protease
LERVSGGFFLRATQVQPDGPAAQAGLRNYDVIVQAGTHKVTTADDLIGALVEGMDGAGIDLHVRRGEAEITLRIQPQEQSSPKAKL